MIRMLQLQKMLYGIRAFECKSSAPQVLRGEPSEAVLSATDRNCAKQAKNRA